MKETEDLNTQIGLTLIDLGIYPHLRGYVALKEAVAQYCNLYSNGYSFGIYNSLSKKFNISEKTLESNIRSAIKTAHNLKMLHRINSYIGSNVVTDSVCPTNIQLISILSQYFYFLNQKQKS